MKRCPACDGKPTEQTIPAREMMFGLGGSFTYRECRSCGSLWLKDVPDDLNPFYPPDYYSMEAEHKPVIQLSTGR